MCPVAIRSLASPQAHKELIARIDTFLMLLGPHFLTAPAQQCIEFLVRQHRAERHNVGGLLICALPFHETDAFVRLVQILHCDNHPQWWCFDEVRRNGVAMPRTTLAKLVTKDLSCFSAIVEAVITSAKQLRKVNRHLLSLVSLVARDVLHSPTGVKEEVLQCILPLILCGAQRPQLSELYLASLSVFSEMIVAVPQLSETTSTGWRKKNCGKLITCCCRSEIDATTSVCTK